VEVICRFAGSLEQIMNPLLKALLPVAAIALVMAPPSRIAKSYNNEPSCGGHRYNLVGVSDGGPPYAPYVELNADSVSGRFLLDYGATKSSISARTFAASNGAIASLSIPRYTPRFFELKRYADRLQPAQIGVIGVDLLSTLAVELNGNTAFLSEMQCKPEQLRARRLIPIAQKGFFSSRPSTGNKLQNVPVVFVRLGVMRTWAQIDTGYEDFVYAHSIDINQAFFEQLLKSNMKHWQCRDPYLRRPGDPPSLHTA
jgi:hypothetical protein